MSSPDLPRADHASTPPVREPGRSDVSTATDDSDHRALRFGWLDSIRARVRRLPGGAAIWRVAVAVIGLVIIGVGVLLLPLPGPGWLIIFLGLGVWATEFEWASRLLGFARRQVKRWTDWMGAQSRPTQVLVGAAGLIFLAGVLYGSWRLVQLL